VWRKNEMDIILILEMDQEEVDPHGGSRIIDIG
jgi:hypothetical protein